MNGAPRTLAIETATEACSVALYEGSELIAGEHVVLGRGHAERLVPMIEALPGNGKAARIMVSLGPGSFTGVRIGIATARALGFAWRAEVVGYRTLALVAAMAQHEDGTDPVTVCMNGGHGEWFIENFSSDTKSEGELRSLPPAQAVDYVGHSLIAGNRASELAGLLEQATDVRELLPNASMTHLLQGFMLTTNLSPVYGRGPDAKLPAA